MQQSTITLIVAGMGIGGTLGSGLVAQWMTRNSQQKQWLLNNRKEEFRELMTALARSYSAIQRVTVFGKLAEEDGVAIQTAESDAMTTIRDRIYTSFEVQELKIESRWSNIAMLLIRLNRDAHGKFNELMIDLTIAALKNPDERSTFSLKRKR